MTIAVVEEQDAAVEELTLVYGFEGARGGDLLRMHDEFQIAGFVIFDGGIQQDPAAVHEDDVGEKVLKLFHLMGGDDDSPAAIEVVVEQGVIELLAIESVQADGGLVEHQQSGVDGHDQSEVELGHHAFGQMPDFRVRLDGGL